MIVSEEDAVACIPLVLVRNRIGVEVPASVVPVHVHDAANRPSLYEKPSTHHPPNHEGLNLIRDLKVH